MNVKNKVKSNQENVAGSGVQASPTFTTGLAMPMSAMMCFLKAQQAYAEGQWQQTCVFAQAAIKTARNEIKVRQTAQNLLAAGLMMMHQIEQALGLWLELDASAPNDVNILANIGFALTELQRHDEAIQYLQRAIGLMPDHVSAHINLGLAYSRKGDIAHAKTSFIQAARINPKYATAKICLGDVLQAEGLIEEAMVAYGEGLALEPNNLKTLNSMIFTNHSLYPFNMSRQMELVRRFGTTLSSMLTPLVKQQKLIQLSPHTPLRVGIVSADFCQHVVASFLESTLEQIIQEPSLNCQLMLVGYYNRKMHDEATVRLQNKFDLWRQVDEWSDAQLVEQIKQDHIDILIDLSGHTAGSRLAVFAQKPAPLQLSWLGYWGSTGLSSIDYVLADPFSIPQSEEKWFVEKIWRMPNLRYCFSTPNNAPDVCPPPCLKNKDIVFGSYQFLRKINHGVLGCWVKILAACPLARLRIQSLSFAKQEVRDQFVERLKAIGIDTDRVDLVGGMSTYEYLASYAEVDVLLDTFPYPGGTTTAEALWMGVPTLTLATTGMLGRQGEALMINAGLSDWVVQSEEDYIQKAIALGNADEQQRLNLSTLRAGLREQVRHSPVFDARKFAADFVGALYEMWQQKVDSRS